MTTGSSFDLNFTPAVPAPRIVGPGYRLSRLISSYIGYAIVMVVLVVIVPMFESAFRNIDLKLPAMTVALLQFSRFCTRYYLWAVCTPAPAMWAMVNVSISDKYRRRRLRLAAFLFVVAFLIFTLIALFLPMSHLIELGSKAVQQ